ncbi:MAG: hypothetical protein QF438_03965, partial [Phycisphaerales bacterium]|nr:hypothetical protein [Phycisphaerales bacterium]
LDGRWGGGGILMIYGRLIANNCSIVNNIGLGIDNGPGGGGITCSDSYVELIGCDVSSNDSTTGVGSGIKDDGLHVVGGAPCEIFVEGCTFIGNYSTDSEAGAAMYLSDGGDGLITSTRVCGSGPDPLHGPWLDGGGNDIDEECSDCPDVDGDGMVGVDEVLAVIAAWGTDDADADVNDDGIVDTNDILLVLSAWGPCE